jgi:hypothetical protein
LGGELYALVRSHHSDLATIGSDDPDLRSANAMIAPDIGERVDGATIVGA